MGPVKGRFSPYKKILILICILNSWFLVFSSSPNFAETIDSIVAIVNEDVITQSEVSEFLSLIYAQMSSIYKGGELREKLGEAKDRILNQMIENKLILQEAKKQNIEIEESEVDERLEEIKDSFSSEEEFEEKLEVQGLTISDLRDRFREQTMVSKLIEREIKLKVVVDPTEVSKYYQEHIGDFQEQERVVISNILIRAEDTSKDAEARLKAEDILNQLKNGADFAELAQRHSQGPSATEGGLIIEVKPGQLMEEIDGVIFNLDVGEVSKLVKTKLGYHIFKLEAKFPARTKDVAEVQDKIRDILFRQKLEQRFKEWVNGLKKRAYIVIKE